MPGEDMLSIHYFTYSTAQDATHDVLTGPATFKSPADPRRALYTPNTNIRLPYHTCVPQLIQHCEMDLPNDPRTKGFRGLKFEFSAVCVPSNCTQYAFLIGRGKRFRLWPATTTSPLPPQISLHTHSTVEVQIAFYFPETLIHSKRSP